MAMLRKFAVNVSNCDTRRLTLGVRRRLNDLRLVPPGKQEPLLCKAIPGPPRP